MYVYGDPFFCGKSDGCTQQQHNIEDGWNIQSMAINAGTLDMDMENTQKKTKHTKQSIKHHDTT